MYRLCPQSKISHSAAKIEEEQTECEWAAQAEYNWRHNNKLIEWEPAIRWKLINSRPHCWIRFFRTYHYSYYYITLCLWRVIRIYTLNWWHIPLWHYSADAEVASTRHTTTQSESAKESEQSGTFQRRERRGKTKSVHSLTWSSDGARSGSGVITHWLHVVPRNLD